jgi:hypothetical protein
MRVVFVEFAGNPLARSIPLKRIEGAIFDGADWGGGLGLFFGYPKLTRPAGMINVKVGVRNWSDPRGLLC